MLKRTVCLERVLRARARRASLTCRGVRVGRVGPAERAGRDRGGAVAGQELTTIERHAAALFDRASRTGVGSSRMLTLVEDCQRLRMPLG